MPQVLNIRQLPGFSERQPIIPPGAVYIGRQNARYGLAASKWANPFRPSRPAEHEAVVAMYERWLRRQPLMDELHELQGCDLVCWCAPLPCHGGWLMKLPEVANRSDMEACHSPPALPSPPSHSQDDQ
jgi:hypothetical protein